MKRILVGITGGIAAYKAVDLCRRLTERGCDVRVVMTSGALEFIKPLTLQAVTGHPVHRDTFDEAAEAAMGHIEIAKWADQVVIAPASADFIARLANGLANDLLSTICLATSAPIKVCPAMNQQMWAAEPTQHNVNVLHQRQQYTIVGPGVGDQACGDVGPGRLLEPLEIVEQVLSEQGNELSGQKWVITAGPTREAIDPVRFLSNHSSGKMGYAIAAAAVNQGADVELISGPVSLSAPSNVHLTQVNTAEEMLQASLAKTAGADVFVACAAVADYRAVEQPVQKIKKSAERMSLELVRNPDILSEIAGQANRPVCVGFAAETENLQQYAKDKLTRKNLDMICANNVSNREIGFDANDNELLILVRNGDVFSVPKSSKQQVASRLVTEIQQRLLADEKE